MNLSDSEMRTAGTYIQTQHVYTLDLNALNVTSTMAMEHEWYCVNTCLDLGNTRVSNHT